MGLTAHARLAADPEAALERAILLAVLPRRPDEGDRDDDHAPERDREDQDSGGGVHGVLVPGRAALTPQRTYAVLTSAASAVRCPAKALCSAADEDHRSDDAVRAALGPGGRRRLELRSGFDGHPVRDPGRCVAGVRAGNARPAAEDARATRSAARPLHGALEQGGSAAADGCEFTA